MTNEERVYLYVERFFHRTECTAWPTVRQAARSLRLRQEVVMEAVEGHESLDLCFPFVAWTPADGDYFIESYDPMWTTREETGR